jgi:hypothetical protein
MIDSLKARYRPWLTGLETRLIEGHLVISIGDSMGFSEIRQPKVSPLRATPSGEWSLFQPIGVRFERMGVAL